jgi:signal transduction histidine kinase
MVEDDGIGFNQEQLSVALNDGMGLRNVLTRAKSLGGNFTADAQPGKGMLATIEIPV